MRYDPLYWGAVFPLGMYTTGTLHLARSLDLPFLLVVPRVFVFFAAAAWLAVFVGLATRLARAVLEGRPSARRLVAE